MKIKYIKFNDDVQIPKQAHYNDSGLDCYSTIDVTLKQFEPTLIPLGFGIVTPDGIECQIRGRSSLNSKGIITTLGTVDSGYRGELKVCLINLTNKDFIIKKGDRVCQLVFSNFIQIDLVDTLDDERKEGGFGSTGK